MVLLLLGKRPCEQVLPLLQTFEAAHASFSGMQADVMALSSIGNPSLATYAMGNQGQVPIVFCASDEIFRLMPALDGRCIALVVDRSSRLTAIIDTDTPANAVERALYEISLFPLEAGRSAPMSAPVLIVPNLIDRQFCRDLIDRFEAGPHVEGVMASMNGAGDGYAKLDTTKKHRRDFILEPSDPLHARVVEALARQLVPEIKRAFQADVAHLDRILIARYDDSGGYFRRHRDDAAAHISYRQFALSLNLNTGEYEGGDIMFPEYVDDRFAPPAGGAAVFSASLLHEATAITRGQRYVLLTFLHGAEAEARRLAHLKTAA